ncbi:unnamed protein product [Caenorhabditis bovis]|uniref:CRIB domain-containing protein n=1 Tax=Caenorhabditis bovis TaxID=2654633 RepID=A0A8S1ENV6_9PELO|nr:unnamed protein product [Caenorhabditis bovis]
MSSVITLDVEGVFFKTRISTLISIDGTYFSRLFCGNWKDQLDREGRLFIDRDASIFPVILNFLRDHEKCPLPKDEYHLQRILREAVFFNILPLKVIIEQRLRVECTCEKLQNENIPIPKPPHTKPPPPPPPAQVTVTDVQVPMRKTAQKKNSVKKSAESISLPKNFTHIAHVGWNGESVMFNKKLSDDQTVKKICDAAAEAVDMNAVYNVVNRGNNNQSESVEVLITGGVMQSKDGTSRL